MADKDVATRPSAKLVEWLASRAELDGQDLALEVASRQLDAVMTAQTEEEMWAAVETGGTLGGRELEDVEIQVDQFIVRPSTGQYKAPLGHFIIITGVRLSDGSPILINTGSPLIIGILRWLEAKELLPAQLVIRGDDTPNGRRLWMERIPSRMPQAQSE